VRRAGTLRAGARGGGVRIAGGLLAVIYVVGRAVWPGVGGVAGG